MTQLDGFMMMNDRQNQIVLIDDDEAVRSLLFDFFTAKGKSVVQFPLATHAIPYLEQNRESVDVIISDINMPEMDGLTLAKTARSNFADIPIILITAFGTVDTAVNAIQAGAYDYFTKPFKLPEVEVVINRAMEFRRLNRVNRALSQEVKQTWKLEEMIGKDPSMQKVFDLIKRIAPVNSNVLIHGESGTGKELVARAIHNRGNRANKPFVAINCTAIPENLLESELFGHAKGSFTGAIGQKIGLFEEADGGTLFLDEIGDLDLALQAKLLRVIQERKIRPVGSNKDKAVDVRILAATHRDLKERVREGKFREDLFFRMNVIPIELPPLRQRRQDIPLLAEHFLRKYSAMNQLRIDGFSKHAMEQIIHHSWRGNVRELENTIERAVVLCTEHRINDIDIPDKDSDGLEEIWNESISALPTLEELERKYIEYVLHHTNGHKCKAADILGINRRTLYRKEKDFGLGTGSEANSPM